MAAAYTAVAYREIYSANSAEDNYAEVVSLYSDSTDSDPKLSLEVIPSGKMSQSLNADAPAANSAPVSPGYRDALNSEADSLPNYSEACT
jgi:hypothetical protein